MSDPIYVQHLSPLWLLCGEEGYVYGLFETLPDAMEWAACSARLTEWEGGDDDIGEIPTTVDDVKLLWTLEYDDGRPYQRKLTAHRRRASGLIGIWYIERLDFRDGLPVLSQGELMTGEVREAWNRRQPGWSVADLEAP